LRLLVLLWPPQGRCVPRFAEESIPTKISDVLLRFISTFYFYRFRSFVLSGDLCVGPDLANAPVAAYGPRDNQADSEPSST
jgi:hypothetical protein